MKKINIGEYTYLVSKEDREIYNKLFSEFAYMIMIEEKIDPSEEKKARTIIKKLVRTYCREMNRVERRSLADEIYTNMINKFIPLYFKYGECFGCYDLECANVMVNEYIDKVFEYSPRVLIQ